LGLPLRPLNRGAEQAEDEGPIRLDDGVWRTALRHRERGCAAIDDREDAAHATELVLSELELNPDEIRELQNVPVAWLLGANAAVGTKITLREPGMTPNSTMIDGQILPSCSYLLARRYLRRASADIRASSRSSTPAS
jgi:hypothetical protein